MGAGRDWDYALVIRGVKPKSLTLLRIGDYIREFALLLGDEGRPTFAGMVDGSVALRVKETSGIPPQVVQSRMRRARQDPEAPGGKHFARLNELMASDQAMGVVRDRQDHDIIALPGRELPSRTPDPGAIVSDVGILDGVVIAIGGRDETMHLELRDGAGAVRLATVRSVEVARELALHFRQDAIRVHVHGKWRRTAEGWEPHTLYVDRIEALDNRNAREIFDELASLPANGWAATKEPLSEWQALRGDD